MEEAGIFYELFFRGKKEEVIKKACSGKTPIRQKEEGELGELSSYRILK